MQATTSTSALARWLLRERNPTGADSFVLTQEFLAEMLGVGRTSVSLVAHALQQSGLISYRRGHITTTSDPLGQSATAPELWLSNSDPLDRARWKACATARASAAAPSRRPLYDRLLQLTVDACQDDARTLM